MENVTEYRLDFYGIFGRNRNPKFFSTALFRVVPGFNVPASRLEEQSLAQLNAIKAKNGEWSVHAINVEVRDDGLEIRSLRPTPPVVCGVA